MVLSTARPQPSPTRRADPCNPLATQTLAGLGQQMDLVATPFPILTPALRLANCCLSSQLFSSSAPLVADSSCKRRPIRKAIRKMIERGLDIAFVAGLALR